MGIFRHNRLTKASEARHAAITVAREPLDTPALEVVEPALNPGSNDDSDFFVCRGARESQEQATPLPLADAAVTLFVFGWHNVEPGPLSWQFRSLRTALDAVTTMRNAARWCIVSGESWDSLENARAGGAVLIEQLS